MRYLLVTLLIVASVILGPGVIIPKAQGCAGPPQRVYGRPFYNARRMRQWRQTGTYAGYAPQPVQVDAAPGPPPPDPTPYIATKKIAQVVLVKWKYIEPTEGDYDFDAVEDAIVQAKSGGYYQRGFLNRQPYWTQEELFVPLDGPDYCIRVQAGHTCPKWLLEKDHATFPLQDPLTGEEIGRMPDAHDHAYLHAVKKLQAAIEEHYGKKAMVEFAQRVNYVGRPPEKE